MLARLQQFITIAGALVALTWAVALWRAGHPVWAVVGVALVVGGHAGILAIEFVLMGLVHRDDPTPKATPMQLLRAWWGEVRAAAVVFGWRQPFRSRRWPDHLPDHPADHPPADGGGRRGLVLVHGFVCNRGLWNRWLERLTRDRVPFVAVDLEPVFGSIDDYTGIIEAAVARVERCTGLAPVVVAHSMGGLALRRWWTEQDDDDRLHHVVTIGTPHRGTWLARFAWHGPGLQMRQLSDWLGNLSGRERAIRAARLTCFYGHCDNIVFPPQTATMPGADNRHLPGVAHVAMADRHEPWDEVRRRLAEPPQAANSRSPGSTAPASISPESAIVSRTRA